MHACEQCGVKVASWNAHMLRLRYPYTKSVNPYFQWSERCWMFRTLQRSVLISGNLGLRWQSCRSLQQKWGWAVVELRRSSRLDLSTNLRGTLGPLSLSLNSPLIIASKSLHNGLSQSQKLHESNTSASSDLQSWPGSGKEGTEWEHSEGHRFCEQVKWHGGRDRPRDPRPYIDVRALWYSAPIPVNITFVKQ